MKIYCTLFDKNYLVFGVALLRSVLRFGGKAYVLCLDQETYNALIKLKLENVILINSQDFYPDLFQSLKDITNYPQKCWIAQPYLCEYVLENFNESGVTYIDSDCYYFADPQPLYDELTNYSVGAVPHNFHPDYQHFSKISGEFCVHFNFFRNDQNAKLILNKWKEDCLDYNKDRPLEYPGQLRMDSWKQYPFFKTIVYPGGGVAPWNLSKFRFERTNQFIVEDVPVVFYHFHGLYNLFGKIYYKGNYEFDKFSSDCIYQEYLKVIEKTKKEIILATNEEFSVRKMEIDIKFLKNLFLRILSRRGTNLLKIG